MKQSSSHLQLHSLHGYYRSIQHILCVLASCHDKTEQTDNILHASTDHLLLLYSEQATNNNYSSVYQS